MVFFLKKFLLLFFIFSSLFVFGDSRNRGKCHEVFSNFLVENYNEKIMHEHLRLIKERGYPTEISKTLIDMFEQNTDVGLRGMIGRVLGEYRLARYNRKKVVSLMIQALNDKDAHYLERVGMAEGLGYLLKPTDEIEIRELAKALKNSFPEVRRETALSLRRIRSNNEYKYEVVQSVQIQELYRRHIKEKKKKSENAPDPFDSWFEARVFLVVHKKGYFVIPQFEAIGNREVFDNIEPYYIDLVIIGPNGKKLAVELDGNHHENDSVRRNDRKRQKKLESVGLEFYRISYKDFDSQPDQTLKKLWKKLDDMGIKPFSESKQPLKSRG